MDNEIKSGGRGERATKDEEENEKNAAQVKWIIAFQELLYDSPARLRRRWCFVLLFTLWTEWMALLRLPIPFAMESNQPR